VCALLVAGLWISARAGAQQQEPPVQQQQPQPPPEPDAILVPHRATYEMKLSVARTNSGIVEVNGRMVLETVDACDGWEIKQRIKLTFLRNDGEEFVTDSNFSSYESKDGLELRFSVRNAQNDEVEEELRGHADLEGLGAKGRATFSLPEARSFELPAGTLFPTTHIARIIRHAREGEKSVSYKVFDGARLDGAFNVNAVIGKSPRPPAGAPPMRGDLGLLRVPSWGVRLAFFASDDLGAQPEYELALDLLSNGIARSMLLDYGDFAVDARLIQLQALPRPKC
jgi:EipB-like